MINFLLALSLIACTQTSSAGPAVIWGPGGSAKVLTSVGGLLLNTASATCDSTLAGSLRWQSSALDVCNGTNWVNVATGSVSGVLALSAGGTAKNMTAVNGGVVYTDADSQEVTAAGTSGQILKSNGAAAPTWRAKPVGDWASFTPTAVQIGSGDVTNETVTGKWRQNGEGADFQVKVVFSSTSAAFDAMKIGIGSVCTITASKVNDTASQILGLTYVLDNGVLDYQGFVRYLSTTFVVPATYKTAGDSYTHLETISNILPITFNTNDTITLTFSVPGCDELTN